MSAQVVPYGMSEELRLRDLVGMNSVSEPSHPDKPVVFRETVLPEGTVIREIEYPQGYGTT